ncbi:MAG: hypothetical protein NXH72_09810 [Hyphomonadaceae bacterium]|nr:hypothetical protein [Hyphomonadaceae bacterium]
MPDIRALPIEERRALAAEAERRARAGERPTEIAAALGISLTTYGRWAALFGFRLSDLDPDHKQGRAVLAVGPRGGPSGRFMLRQGLGGRVKGSGRPPGIDLTAEGLTTAKAVLGAVRAALAGGDRGRADRLIAAWKVQARRARDLAALEAEAAEALAADETAPLSDAALAAEVSALLGRGVRARE